MKTTLLQFLFAFILSFAVNATSSGAPAGIPIAVSDAPATPGAIKGETTVCVGQTVSYAIDPVAGAMSYTWTVPAGWAIITGQGITQITVKAGNTVGQISVVAENQYGTSGSRQLQVAFGSAPGKPGAIAGADTICAGMRAIFTVDAVSNALGYMWTVPAGWTIISGQSTRQLDVMVSDQEGTVYVTAQNECGQSQRSGKEVLVMSAISNNTVEGNQEVCLGDVPAPLGGSSPTGADGRYTYSWESSTTGPDANFVAANGTNNNQYYTPGQLAETTWFRRKVLTAFCEQISEVVKVEMKPVPARPAIERSDDTSLRANVDGAYYEWRRDGITLGVHTQTIDMAGEGVYDVRVRNTNGCFSPFSNALDVRVTGLYDDAVNAGVRMSLHPATGRLAVSSDQPMTQVELRVINLLGIEVYRKQLPRLDESAAFEVGSLPAGVYLLLLQSPAIYLKQKVLVH